MKLATNPALTLAPEQLRIAHLFGLMDRQRQREALVRMERIAGTHPRIPRPFLRLVQEGQP